MASDLNRVTLIGRLTRDPELRYTQSGTAVAGFSLANNKTYATSGERKDHVSYIDCVAWSKLGEIITEYCKKGHRIAVDGRLQQRRWDDSNGKKQTKLEVIVENFQFLTEKGQSDEPQHKDSKPDKENNNSDGNPFDPEDTPF